MLCLGPKYVELSDRTLVFTYGLDELRDEKFKGCHFAVEDLLELRPIKLAAAIARAHEKINQDTKALNIPIEINWGTFFFFPCFKKMTIFYIFKDLYFESLIIFCRR